jgi:DUF2937 family protein
MIKLTLLRGLIDRMLLVGAVIAGGLVPGFIAQYRQRLGGRFDQARLDLEPWQRIADEFYHGSIEQLVQYHLNSSDPTIHSEGKVIQALAATVQQLQVAVAALQSSLFHQIAYLALHADGELARATLSDWVPTFALTAEGLTFALLFAIAIWLLFFLIWWLVALGCTRWLGRARPNG